MSQRDFNLPESMQGLRKYNEMINEITRINNLTGPFYMQEFLNALDVAAKYHSLAIEDYEKAIVRSKAVRSVLALDEAPAVLVTRGIKITADNTEAFVEGHDLYIEAKDREAYLLALSTYLKQQVEKFQRAHDDARKIFESFRQPYGQSSAASSN